MTAASISRVVKVDPKDIPEPTPVVFPSPPAPRSSAPPDRNLKAKAASEPKTKGLVATLQDIHRPLDIKSELFDSLGVRAHYDAEPKALVPDPSYIPDFDGWDNLTADQSRERNHDTKRPLSNGNLSPGCQVYRERKTELSTSNQDAFRTVRRLPAPKGQNPVRLGNSYEFFRCLEALTPYWDDCTAPPRPQEGSPDTSTSDKSSASEESRWSSTRSPDVEHAVEYRVMAGSSMAPEHRHNLLSAFIKLVAYDFGCNVTTPRSEPRLYIGSPPSSRPRDPPPRKSYISSGCIFIFRSAVKREQARAGIVDGPVAAVSARATTNLSVEAERNQDLARELIAGLVTAQHRAREGKAEKRVGEGQWWATKKRWGGGSGGPIGKEADAEGASLTSPITSPTSPEGSSSPTVKRARKTLTMYDNYRMVRPPSLNWDKKTRYEAIGRVQGADFDDVFVISSLFHHVSVLRLRVPSRLLDVFDGAEDGGDIPWGELALWRSKWFDLFVAAERIEAMKLLWSVFAYQMRRTGQPATPEKK